MTCTCHLNYPRSIQLAWAKAEDPISKICKAKSVGVWFKPLSTCFDAQSPEFKLQYLREKV
jgi:hypothetical protein